KIGFERAKENLAQTVRQVCETFHQATAYRAEIDEKSAELVRNAQDYFHRDEVFKEQGVSIEDYEHSIAALQAKYASLERSAALYRKTIALIQNTSIMNHPLVMQATDQMRDAWVYLYRCKIYAPVKGLVAQRTIQVGMFMQAGDPLMSVIPLDQIWLNANFKETQLKRMRLGQKVNVTVDLWGVEEMFHGRIVGLPGGAGNVFSLLPPQNLSGNWIKIVQRLPVRVALDPEEIARRPLRIGLTCRAVVDTRDTEGLIVPQTTAGSPLYQTPIFEIEEKGDKQFIAGIVQRNIDPLLAEYTEKVLPWPDLTISLPDFVQEALRQDIQYKNQVNQFRQKLSLRREDLTKESEMISHVCQGFGMLRLFNRDSI
ncbi:MAG: HlyD family efflux transporter periplasmic adaptor subunit, partial [Chlamydiae bacterium]|nr:HlyD family efflux transporter periplasmic adaptor subunit [Chlamydiota bacterium]